MICEPVGDADELTKVLIVQGWTSRRENAGRPAVPAELENQRCFGRSNPGFPSWALGLLTSAIAGD